MAVGYCDRALLEGCGVWYHPGVAAGVLGYDPEREVVLALKCREGYLFEKRASTGLLPDPPQAYEQRRQLAPPTWAAWN